MGYNPISNEQISNPGVTPASSTPPVGGPGTQGAGSPEEAQGRPFSLGPAEGKGAPEAPPDLPSPMQAAGDASRQQPQMIAQPELGEHVAKLQNQLSTIQDRLHNSSFTDTLSDDHFNAMQKVTQKMNPDMQTIAKYSKGEYEPAQQERGQSILDYVSNWINGSQSTLQGALEYLQTDQKPNPADYLRLQYAVQRATQRGELFASIVGSTVSGVKTIMSTQLG